MSELQSCGQYVNRTQQCIIKTNQITRIWPEDYAEFAQRPWQRMDHDAVEVRR